MAGVEAILARVRRSLRRACRDAWKAGLLPAANGNASVRLPPPQEALLCMTNSGSAKGRLTAGDFCLVDAGTGETVSGGPASSEMAVHLALYGALPPCRAVLHSHPACLLALSLVCDEENFLAMPLFETQFWRPRLGFVPELAPGSGALAHAVGARAALLAAENPRCLDSGALWMAGHGLVCWGKSIDDALTLSEELAHLADIQLRTLTVRR